MLKLKKNLKIFVCFALFVSLLCSSASAVRLYSPDGSSENFPESEVASQLADGWYKYPVVRLYSWDGKSEVFAKSEAEAQKRVGWHQEPVKLLYAPDGRTELVAESEVEAQLAAGWYDYPVKLLYAPDGRTEAVALPDVEAQLSVGWYDYPVQTLYTPDGRSSIFRQSEVEAQLTVGWYEEYTMMYDTLGWLVPVHWSKLKNLNHYGYHYEPIDIGRIDYLDDMEKAERVFPDGIAFEDSQAASACMKTITIPIWKMTAYGKKYSSSARLTINSALADDVVKIFTEIYNDPSRFPIKSVGGYNWRTTYSGRLSEHSFGTCIDINPRENYYISPEGLVMSGSHWKPGKDPYSISGDSIVVKTFAKYGWSWGGSSWGEGYNRDFMHFSYLGS